MDWILRSQCVGRIWYWSVLVLVRSHTGDGTGLYTHKARYKTIPYKSETWKQMSPDRQWPGLAGCEQRYQRRLGCVWVDPMRDTHAAGLGNLLSFWLL